MTVDEIYAISSIDCWFLREIRKIVAMEKAIANAPHPHFVSPSPRKKTRGEGRSIEQPLEQDTQHSTREPFSPGVFLPGEKVAKADEGAALAQLEMRSLKREGFSDKQIATLTNRSEPKSASNGTPRESALSTNASTPAPPNSKPRRPTSTRLTNANAKPRRPRAAR